MKKFLVIDDATFMRMMTKDILGKNFDSPIILEADNGEAGVEMFKEHAPDLTILNITMPKMDGIEALRRIRAHDPAARVVMLTAMGQASMVSTALTEGARRFVCKPFSAEKLIGEIRFVLEEKNANPEPFNKEVLTTLTQTAANNAPGSPLGGEILSQKQIDAIIALAEKPASAPHDIGALLQQLLTREYELPPTPPSFDTPPDTPDKLLSILEKLAEGQDKMTTLLERLVSQGETRV